MKLKKNFNHTKKIKKIIIQNIKIKMTITTIINK